LRIDGQEVIVAVERSLDRFVIAQNLSYCSALSELRAGKKTGHWMWYVFPQYRGLGKSINSREYQIDTIQEAADYLAHPILGARLLECASAVLVSMAGTAQNIFGPIDAAKLQSSMTLFSQVENANRIFVLVLDRYFEGEVDQRTIDALSVDLSTNH
jgi:uncharacterized protein (DUF1810 family)